MQSRTSWDWNHGPEATPDHQGRDIQDLLSRPERVVAGDGDDQTKADPDLELHVDDSLPSGCDTLDDRRSAESVDRHPKAE